LTDRAWVSNVN